MRLEAPPPTPRLVDPERVERVESALAAGRAAGTPGIEVAGSGKLLAALAPDDVLGVVLKRLPPFPSEAARSHYVRAVDAYRMLLQDRVGFDLPQQQCVPAASAEGAPVLYVVQERLPAEAFVPALLPHLDAGETARLAGAVAAAVLRVWHRNAIDGPDSWTGLDARPGNWAIRRDDDALSIRYVDTAVPLLRRAGRDLLPAELFLQAVPAPLAGSFRAPLHRALLDRYDVRIALLDLLGGLAVRDEATEAHVRAAVETVNVLLGTEENVELFVDPLSVDEVVRHGRRDARFWRRFHAAGRAHRFVRSAVLRRPYPTVLPEG